MKIIFNYSDALIDTPADVTVHRSSPVVEILHALYFHLTAKGVRPLLAGSAIGARHLLCPPQGV